MWNKLSFSGIQAVAFAAMALFSAPLLSGKEVSPKQEKQPNIVFLFADDLSPFDLSVYENPEVQTPNIDRLAQRGVTFTRAYNMGSNQPAVCVASRTMLLTGKYLWPAVQAATPETMPQAISENRLWVQLLKQAGYTTYFSGKWHVPNARPHDIFDHVVQVRGGMPSAKPTAYNRPVVGIEDPWNPADPKNGGYWTPAGKHWSELLAEDAIGFIQQATKSEQPFFFYLAFNAPHDPKQAPQKFLDLYDLDKIAVPESFLPEYPYKDAIGLGAVAPQNRPAETGSPAKATPPRRILRDELLAPFPRTEYAVRTHRREYYAIISHLDEQIGRILDELEAAGQLENTIVVFAADQGLAIGRHGIMGKQNMYEHSLRLPFIIAGPSIPRGEVCNAPIYLQDVVPTTLELAGSEPAEHVQFCSIIPLLKNSESEAQPRDAIYGAYTHQQRAIIGNEFKLIIYPTINKLRLYHLKNDPQELHDLAELPEYKPQIQELLARFKQLQAEVGDPLTLTITAD